MPRPKILDSFGFVPVEAGWQVGPYILSPVSKYRSTVRGVIGLGHEADGFFYPYKEHSLSGSGARGGRRLVHSRNVQSLFRLPPTHEIGIGSNASLAPNPRFRETEGALLIHAIGFLYGVRCQFHDWWFDDRVPTTTRPVCSFDPSEASVVLGTLLQTYQSWPNDSDRARFTHALYLKSKLRSYRWSWERFIFEYTVFDALHKCLTEVQGLPTGGGHPGRFAKIGSAGLVAWSSSEKSWSKQIVLMRNDLVHEGQCLGMPLTRDIVQRYAEELARLNDRLVFALAGVRCTFTKSSWLTLSRSTLGLR